MDVDIKERLLAVSAEAADLDFIAEAATRSFGIQTSMAATAADAMRLDNIEPHAMIIVGVRLPDMTGLAFAQGLLARRRRSVVLFGRSPKAADVLAAMRLGVSDYLDSPLDRRELLMSIARCTHQEAAMQREYRRQEKTRHLLRRVLRDRRCLNQRIDLICRDMVGAQRRLFHRVLNLEDHDPIGR